MEKQLSWCVASAAVACVVGCGGTAAGTGGNPDASDAGHDAGNPDTGMMMAADHDAPRDTGSADAASDVPGVDHGKPSTTYPAFAPSMAQVKDNGGYVMKKPNIVSITWNSDGSQATFDGFADTIGQTDYWKATTSEYGIGPAVSGAKNHVHMSTTAPATIVDMDIQNLVTTNAGVTAGWPAPTEDTIYAFFLAPGTSLQTPGLTGGMQDACMAGEGGYHNEVVVGGNPTTYAVVPSCNFGGGITPEQQSTLSMSHELIEGSTDPQPPGGYYGFDTQHFSFTYFQIFQAETGDACELYANAFFEDKETKPVAFDAWVQRTWSNAGAAAGHDPCVPAAPGMAYFNVTPLTLSTVDVTVPSLIDSLTGQTWKNPTPTLGVHVPAGKSVTFPVGFYSDGPTGGPWTISVASGNPILAGTSAATIFQTYNPSSLTVSVDKTSGENGEKAYITVNVKSQGTLFEGEIVTVTSTMGGVSHYMPIWVGN